ncbi:AI-2E family transporter [Myxosarcina sp. GI1]|uniref:AI-2E family transporter n=1 Tax=Myxosarcina sp. GI1 TaxID=1541065 RepID=UPI00055BE827|nr:AI-2E family transporter [Myxosarcina sp. GI1]
MAFDSNLPKWAIAGLAFPLIFLNGWLLYQLGSLLQPVTNIVITATLIAALLDYPIKFLEQQKIARGWAIAFVLLITLLLASIAIIFLAPLVWQQLLDFAERSPRWIEQAKTQILQLSDRLNFENSLLNVDQLIVQATNQLSNALNSATSKIVNIILGTIDSAVNFLATFILSILLVFSGERLWNGILSWFSDNWRTRIQNSLRSSFQRYFLGQATLALILATAQSIAFVVLNVPLGLLFGIFIGLASLIPFGGTIAILGISILLAFQNVWLGLKVLIVAIIVVQINDNLVAPRLIGGITGLNPAIIIVVLLIGAKFAGFLGLILAVPTSSFIKKIVDIVREPVAYNEQNNVVWENKTVN